MLSVSASNGALILIEENPEETLITIEMVHQAKWPVIYIMPRSCDAARNIDLVSQWTVGEDCQYLSVQDDLLVGMPNLLIPVASSMRGFVLNAACRTSLDDPECDFVAGVDVTLTVHRKGSCGAGSGSGSGSCTAACAAASYYGDCVGRAAVRGPTRSSGARSRRTTVSAPVSATTSRS